MIFWNRHNASGLNVRLIELSKGVPVVALFYLTCLDLIYVKTVEETLGYVPRDSCRPISITSVNRQESVLIPIMIPQRAAIAIRQPSMVFPPPPPPPPPLTALINEAYPHVVRDFAPIRSNHIGFPVHRMSDIGECINIC